MFRRYVVTFVNGWTTTVNARDEAEARILARDRFAKFHRSLRIVRVLAA
jgi:hypothetical protein